MITTVEAAMVAVVVAHTVIDAMIAVEQAAVIATRDVDRIIRVTSARIRKTIIQAAAA